MHRQLSGHGTQHTKCNINILAWSPSHKYILLATLNNNNKKSFDSQESMF